MDEMPNCDPAKTRQIRFQGSDALYVISRWRPSLMKGPERQSNRISPSRSRRSWRQAREALEAGQSLW